MSVEVAYEEYLSVEKFAAGVEVSIQEWNALCIAVG